MLKQLEWSQPRSKFWAVTEAKDCGSTWRITPVPRDVARIDFEGSDADGTIVRGFDYPAYAETADEAQIVIGVLRAGTRHLPDWREQLEAAGFARTYPDAKPGELLSQLWNDNRRHGHYQVTVMDGSAPRTAGDDEVSVRATYESGRSTFWHNVCGVTGGQPRVFTSGDVRIRTGLPEGVDALKAGVAAAIAIRAARVARGGRFATPLGGETRSR